MKRHAYPCNGVVSDEGRVAVLGEEEHHASVVDLKAQCHNAHRLRDLGVGVEALLSRASNGVGCAIVPADCPEPRAVELEARRDQIERHHVANFGGVLDGAGTAHRCKVTPFLAVHALESEAQHDVKGSEGSRVLQPLEWWLRHRSLATMNALRNVSS